MKAIVKLEAKEYGQRQKMKKYGRLLDQLSLKKTNINWKEKEPYVAEVTYLESNLCFKRTFLKKNTDLRKASNEENNGVYYIFILSSGHFYEVNDRKEKYFCEVDESGEVVKIPEEELKCKLNQKKKNI